MTPKSFAYHHLKTLSVEFFNTPIPFSAGFESLFSLGIKTFFAQRGSAVATANEVRGTSQKWGGTKIDHIFHIKTDILRLLIMSYLKNFLSISQKKDV